MSHSNGAIKTEDNQIFYIEYNGTADVCLPNLYKTVEEVEANWRKQIWKTCICKPITLEPVKLAVTYGGGWFWDAFICLKCMVITKRFEPFGDDDEYKAEDGLPEWYPDREIFLHKD